jgi:hypothetical protein
MRLLNLLGVEVGPEEDLLAPVLGDNTRGYFEPGWMVELNEEILARLGTAWWRPLPAGPGWEHEEALEPLRERARTLLAEKFPGAAPGGNGLWGWKDPRTNLTLPFWRELIPEARYVICLRNPADVASSLQRRPEPSLSIGEWGEVWLEQTARALLETQGNPRLLLFYEDLLEDPRGEVQRIASFLGVPTPALDGPDSPLAEIAHELRHHSTSPLELAATSGIPPAARALFLALRAARERPGEDLAEAVERLAPELWWEWRTLTDLQATFAESRQTNALLEEERQDLIEATARAEGQAAELRALIEGERAGFQEERAGFHAELERARGELEYARTALGACEVRREEARAEIDALKGQLERGRAVLEGVQSSVSWRLTAPLRALKGLVRSR